MGDATLRFAFPDHTSVGIGRVVHRIQKRHLRLIRAIRIEANTQQRQKPYAVDHTNRLHNLRNTIIGFQSFHPSPPGQQHTVAARLHSDPGKTCHGSSHVDNRD